MIKAVLSYKWERVVKELLEHSTHTDTHTQTHTHTHTHTHTRTQKQSQVRFSLGKCVVCFSMNKQHPDMVSDFFAIFALKGSVYLQ